MLTFLDGPAAVASGLLARAAPEWLRVVCGPDGKWDCLDQPGDMPAGGERVYLYRRVGEVDRVHLRMRKGSGWYAIATYSFVEPQPDEETLRGIRAWKEWLVRKAAT